MVLSAGSATLFFPFLLHGEVGWGMGEKQMECGSCSLPYWGTELPRPTGEKAPRMELRQEAAKMGKGRATGPGFEALSRSH